MSELERRTLLHLLHGQMLLMEANLRHLDGDGLTSADQWMGSSVSLASELEDEIIDEGEEFYPVDDEDDDE